MRIFELTPGGRGPFSALKITVAPHSHLPAIHHAKMSEFFYVLKGSGYGCVGSRQVRFKVGEHVFIPPRVPHDFHTGASVLEALVIFAPRFDPKRPDVVRIIER
ncbi:MAG: cupin domain-containing protein [Elusimicrobia bacterium]|nr:cupin domain-containing protein [Elusimicrobiota bacterium]